MKATEKIKLMMRLEKGFQKLDLEELHMIKDTLNKEIDNKFKLFHRGERLHKAVLKPVAYYMAHVLYTTINSIYCHSA